MVRTSALGLTLAAGLLLAARAAAADKEVTVFNGKDLAGWKVKGSQDKSKWVVGRVALNEKDPAKFDVTPVPPEADGGPAPRVLINGSSGGVDLYTEEKFGDCQVEV